MEKRVVGLMGSYRRGGTIDQAVTAVLEAARERGATTAKIDLLDQRIEFCRNCRTCCCEPGPERGKCVIEDDFDGVMRQLESADAIVIGAPVNFGDVNALTRRFLERMVGCYDWPWERYIPRARALGKKPAVLVTSSASPGMLTRLIMHPFTTLKVMAKLLGARPIEKIVVGHALEPKPDVPCAIYRAAARAGMKLAA